MKKFLKTVGWILLLILLLCGGLTLSLRIPAVQNYIAHRAVDYLSKKLGTKVAIQSFEWSLFRNIDLKGFYMADKKGDTMIYAGTVNAEISYWSLLGKQVKIKGISLDNARVYLQNDTAGNLNLAALFAGTKDSTVNKLKQAADTVVKPFGVMIELENLNFSNTDFKFEDLKKHLLVSVLIPSCNVELNKIALEKKLIDIHSIDIDGVKSD
jgi:uncharacterized protein involved in outer membrane biogenesis